VNDSKAAVWCPAPDCDYGENGGKAIFRGKTMAEALRHRNSHLVSAHPGFKPPTGSMRDKIPKLD
jgi:hypothetical protein